MSLWIDGKSRFSLSIQNRDLNESCGWEITGHMPNPLKTKGTTRLARKDIDLKRLNDMLSLCVNCFDLTTASDLRNRMAIFNL